jgi:zinc protease
MNMYRLLFLLTPLFSIAAALSAQSKSLPIEEFKLKNGMEVKMITFGTIPVVSIAAYINVGKKTETPGLQYLAKTTSEAVLLGTEKYSRTQLDNLLTTLGASIKTSCNDNYTEFNMHFLEKDANASLDLFSSILLKPLFPAEEIKEQIGQILDYNNPYKMDINDICRMFSDYVVFGTAHPLGRHFYASQLKKVTPAQIREFYQFNYTPKNTKLVLAGNFDKHKMKEQLEALFGSWNASLGENNGSAYEVQDITKKEYFFVNKKRATQTSLRWNKKAPDAGSKDAIPFHLANEALNVLLFDEIRAKEGKTYGIRCSWNEDENSGVYAVSTQVRNEVAYETTVSFDRVLKQFYDTGVTQAQIDKAKASLRNSRLSAENPLSIIAFYNPILYKDIAKRNEYLNILAAISLDQVNRVIKKYFSPVSYKLVMVGDETTLEPQLVKISGLVRLPLNSIEKDN